MSASESINRLPEAEENGLTRRTVIAKVRYVPPAVAVLAVLKPEVALGRSGPGKGNGKAKGKGKGKGKGN